jgi:hypothetical protein
MKNPAPSPEFWVTNFSNRNVVLADLACTIKAYTTVNLADMRRYGLTLAQLNKSKESGSLLLKKDTIRVREAAPIIEPKKTIPFAQDSIIPSRERSLFSIKETHYDELRVSDEQYAEENAELADLNDKISPLTSKKV